MDQGLSLILEQAKLATVSPSLLLAASLAVVGSIAALLQWSSYRRIAGLQASIKSRDERLAKLQNKLQLISANELQERVLNLQPQPRRRITAQQQTLLAENAILPPERAFTMEIIHDMAGSDCSAYANDFRAVFKAMGWSTTRSAVLRPGWVARCGLGVHVRNRNLLSRPETVVINALAAAGIDYDLVRIPELEADVGLLVTPTTPNRLNIHAYEGVGSIREGEKTLILSGLKL